VSAMISWSSDADAECVRRHQVMPNSRDSQFRTGQPVWVIQPAGPPRSAEYVGESESRGPHKALRALVIYADASGADVVEVSRLRPREAVERRARRTAQAGGADPTRAERPRQRGQSALAAPAERLPPRLKAGALDPRERVQAAIERAFAAADAANEAEAGAAEALDRAAATWERVAHAQQRLVEAAERYGDVRAPAHRLAVTEAFQRATGAREAAAAARQRISGP
jgi:hypothetical protein